MYLSKKAAVFLATLVLPLALTIPAFASTYTVVKNELVFEVKI